MPINKTTDADGHFVPFGFECANEFYSIQPCKYKLT